MLRDRYAPQDLFALVQSAGLALDPVLARLDTLLDDDDLYQRVRADLARRRPQTATRGRHSTPVEVVLRLLVVKRLYGWSYEETERFVADSLVLRQFCRVYLQPVPDDTTLIRWANLIGPATVAALNDRVVALAQEQRVTRGRKLRIDGTVVETTIRYPTDSKTLGDGVRVLSRLLRRAKGVLGDGAALGQAAFRTRTRSVRRLTQQLHRVARRKGEQAAEDLKQAYAKLIGVAQASRRQAQRVATALRDQALDQGQRLAERFDQLLPLVAQAIAQATRRVLRGETVPAADKLLSLFEPHTQAIRRHKAGKLTEFGRKVLLDEVEGGIVSHFAILDDVGLEHPHFIASLDAHQERFGHPPDLVAGDRGLYSAENEERARERGVRRVVLPKVGRASRERQQHERQRWFRRGFRFRAGAEGRINVLKRDYGLDRCRDHGEAGFGRWVGWGILTHNLAQIAKTQAARATRPAPAARRAA
ncbi:MAG TPA: ISNCY family transposase [Chloroflexia bacterium]|nr:ISNCY family transposase [Chloroflexia bacterium]